MSIYRFILPFLGLLLAPLTMADSAPAGADKVWVAGWRETAPLNIPRAGAAVIKAGNTFYAIGGIDGRDFLRTVEYSRVRADGTLTPWQLTAALNEQRGFFDAVVYKGYIYAVGGANGPGGKHLLRSVERARIQPDGSLGPWQREASQLVYPRRCIKLSRIGDTLYALGGFGGTLLDSVESARIQADGSIGPWSLETRRLTMPRYVNTVKTHGDTIYVIGGHNQSEGSGRIEVEYATADAAGELSPWKETTAMAFGRYALSAAIYRSDLYALGGLQGAIYSDVIESTHIKSQGGVTAWRKNTPLSSPRANFGVVVRGDTIYIIGGTNRDGYFRSVEYANFNASGDIGFRATATEAAAYEQKRKTRQQSRLPRLPNKGRVTDIIHTRLYSYIEVEDGGSRHWIAAPRSEFARGDVISYSRGVTMTNFHSSTLKRDFPLIIFVEHARKTSGSD